MKEGLQAYVEEHAVLMLLRSTVRSNVKPKCGNDFSLSLHVFLLYPIGYGLEFLLFWVSAKFRYSLRTRWRSKVNALVIN